MDKKQFLKLYKNTPQELRNVLVSEEKGDDIEEICFKYDIIKYLFQINDLIGNVLLGLLPPDQFQEKLEKELNIKKEKAKKITREINRYVFYPVKSSLEDLYNIEIAPAAKMRIKPSMKNKIIKKEKPEDEEEKKESKDSEKKKPEEKKTSDTYREPIE
jgi:hypothetical protein